MINFLYNWYLFQNEVKDGTFKKYIFWKLYKFLKIVLPIYYKKIEVKKLESNSNNEIIVSLTSFPARIEIVYLTLKSIFIQSYKPRLIVLYLANSQFTNKENDLPHQLLKLKEKGLIIKFCEDLGPHKKYYHAFKDFKDSKVVLVDDDVIYPKDMIKTLVDHSKANQNCIIANRIREIKYNNNKLVAYRSWKINKLQVQNPSKFLFATGVGGVLYNPNFFSSELYNVDVIKEICINADDIWLKANSIVNNKKVFFTNKYFNSFIELPDSQKESLFAKNVFLADNDLQISKVFNYFNINEEKFQ
ncbi:glycosyltransferase family A protein [Flavobacterium sp.]|uniref:glycosyltransferase family A protein n=1 Tax=Flavobacterium sp. TaxID=239 RepID=UPI002611EA9B|nr:glycosyltransferase family A protein [Flavobacterium sp.]MDD3003993.1 glycosyltransferase family A protein [Flavobacterium sp.]